MKARMLQWLRSLSIRMQPNAEQVATLPKLVGWRRLLTVEWMLLAVWLLGFAVSAMQPLNDPDTPWHLAAGRYILSHHVVPTHDVFSWSMRGKPWVTQEWGFEVCLAWMANHFSYAGMWFLLVVIHSLTVLVLYRLVIRVTDGNRVLAAVLACLGTLPAIPFWILRPQIISYLLFVVFLWILQRVREGHLRTLWLVPPLMLLWANMHGSAIIGVLMLVLEVGLSYVPTIGRFSRITLSNKARLRVLLAAAAGLAMGLLNPNGIKTYTYALLSTNSLLTNNIVEWNSPNFHNDYYKYGVLAFLAFVLLISLARYRPLPLREVLYFGGCLAETLMHQRFMPYLALAAIPLLAPQVADWTRSLLQPSRVMRMLNGLIIIAATALFGWKLSAVSGPIRQHLSSSSYPIFAVDYLEAHHLTHMKLLNAYGWGGYLIYRGIPTFIDGRTDIYMQDNVFANYLNIQNAGWNVHDLLNSYHFDVVLFAPNYALTPILSNDPNWTQVYRDMTAVIFVRKGSQAAKQTQ